MGRLKIIAIVIAVIVITLLFYMNYQVKRTEDMLADISLSPAVPSVKETVTPKPSPRPEVAAEEEPAYIEVDDGLELVAEETDTIVSD